MRAFLLNSKGQFEFDGQNNIAMVSDDEELMQCVQQIITTNAGEWFLNPSIGWARFNMLGQKADEEQAINDLIAAILDGEPRVAAVEGVAITYNTTGRRAKVSYRITKQDGAEITGEAIV